MRWVVALMFLCACDRVFGLGGRTDAVDAPGRDDAVEHVDAADARHLHDEDSDGVDDLVDLCPGVFEDVESDEDHDGIGDACDPEVGQINHRLLFDPFVNLSTDWSPNTIWTSDGDGISPDPVQPHPDDFRITQRFVEIAANRPWEIRLGLDLPLTTTPLAKYIGLHPTNIGSTSFFMCSVLYDGEWSVTAGEDMQPVAYDTHVVLVLTGHGGPVDTAECTAGSTKVTASFNSISYPLLPQIWTQVPIRFTFIDVIQ